MSTPTPTPAEARWMARMKRLLAKRPVSIVLFGCESGLVALRAGPDGECPMTEGDWPALASDQVLDVLTVHCDGGAW